MAGVLVCISVLIPCLQVTASEEKETEDIVTKIANEKDLSELYALLKAAGLIDPLEGEGPFTVFAPTNEVFEKLPAGVVTELLRVENKEKLEDLLLNHVYAGKLISGEAQKLDGRDIIMLNNKKAKISVKDNAININNAKVIVKDIKAANGMIHIIDAVLLPK